MHEISMLGDAVMVGLYTSTVVDSSPVCNLCIMSGMNLDVDVAHDLYGTLT